MSGPEVVVLVHGLWVHGIVMVPLRRRIARCGYQCVCYSYPSMRLTLTENADRLNRFVHGLDATRIHFVGHSLGGLVVLRMLEVSADTRIGRIVLAGTPYGGSFAARRLSRLPGGTAALGHSVPEWFGRDQPHPPLRHDVGVIAGDMGIGLGRIVAPDMREPNDGVVCVSETRLPHMRDHIVLRVNHTGMLFSSQVARQVCEFIRFGRFAHES